MSKTYFNNRSKQTPDYALTGKKPDLSKMNIFGSACYACKHSKKKLDPSCKKGIFIGYDRNSPAYLVYYPENIRVLKHRQIKFIDNIAKQQTQTYLPNDDDNDLLKRDLTKNPKSEKNFLTCNLASANKQIARMLAIFEDTQNGNGTPHATWKTMEQKPKMKTTRHYSTLIIVAEPRVMYDKSIGKLRTPQKYMALAKATQEGLYLSQLLNELDPQQEYASVKNIRGQSG